jgi:hypothetical protein
MQPTRPAPKLATTITITVAHREVDFLSYGTTNIDDILELDEKNILDGVENFLNNLEDGEYDVEVKTEVVKPEEN